MLALLFGNPDALSLPCFDVDPLIFSDKAEDLEYKITNETADQIIRTAAGIQQRHIQNDNLDFPTLGSIRPFLQDGLIIAAQPVDAFNHQQVLRLQDLL